MNLNPLSWFSSSVGAKELLRADDPRNIDPQGPWSPHFSDWVPRTIAPRFYETLREAVPVFDGAINRLTTMDGILRIEADRDALAREIEEWMAGVKVNDMEQSLQAFYQSQSGEAYEQGCSIGEYVLSENGRDVERLRVADSKGVYFRRAENGLLETWYAPPAQRRPATRDGREQVEDVLRNNWITAQTNPIEFLKNNGYRQLSPDNLIYVGFNNESTNPYGTSLMRSTEFAAKVLLTIENSLMQAWERFGNPSFHVDYKTASKTVAGNTSDLEKRRSKIANDFANALTKKRQGNAVDFVTAVGKDDVMTVNVIGDQGQSLEVEAPARHVLEQIIAKSGLPSWMLGYHWSTAERLAQRQGELMLQESRTRFSLRQPPLERLIATMLRARGRTWKRGEWQLVQVLPNLQDIVAQAQAGFLEAQTELMLSDAGMPGDDGKRFWMDAEGKMSFPSAPFDPRGKGARPTRIVTPRRRHDDADGHTHGKEPFAEDGEYLGRLERRVAGSLLRSWNKLRVDTLDALGLGAHKDPGTFVFSAVSMLAALRELQEAFEQEVGGEGSRLAENALQAWKRGAANAAAELTDPQDLMEEAVARAAQAVRTNSLNQVKNTTARTYAGDVVQILEQGMLNGQNPRDVAAELSERFGAHTNDWRRLAASEITGAHADGKMDRYALEGEAEYGWVTADDSRVCPICDGFEAENPHPVGAGPRPSRDSHPFCRCTIMAW